MHLNNIAVKLRRRKRPGPPSRNFLAICAPTPLAFAKPGKPAQVAWSSHTEQIFHPSYVLHAALLVTGFSHIAGLGQELSRLLFVGLPPFEHLPLLRQYRGNSLSRADLIGGLAGRVGPDVNFPSHGAMGEAINAAGPGGALLLSLARRPCPLTLWSI
jgi:hypothetical protein